MLGERYTLTLRHEYVDIETHKTHELEPPLSICCTLFDPMEQGHLVYSIRDMLYKLEKEFLNRLDGDNNG